MKRTLLLAFFVCLFFGVAALLRAGEPAVSTPDKVSKVASEGADAPRFIRVRRDDQQRPLAMETAVVRYVSPARPGVVVDLVGAVHVADKSYYDELNKLFEKYEVVLYELVAPEGTRVPKGGRKGPPTHPIGAMQEGMTTILELSHQLSCVDYTKENFRHADMSPDDFSKAMQDRGESFMQLFFRIMGTGLAQNASGNSGVNDASLLMALFSKDRATKLKTLMAEQFQNIEGLMSALDGPEGSTIITERNRRCFEVLDKELKAGKKKIAIFYGAGHLPDMERRLETDYGLKRGEEKWLSAWQLQKKSADPPTAN